MIVLVTFNGMKLLQTMTNTFIVSILKNYIFQYSNKISKVFDSWGHFPSGILKENTISFGHFQECLETNIIIENLGNSTIYGQYCLINTNIEKMLNITYAIKRTQLIVPKSLKSLLKIGICIPASCSLENVAQKFGFNRINGSCSIKNQYKFETIDYITL